MYTVIPFVVDDDATIDRRRADRRRADRRAKAHARAIAELGAELQGKSSEVKFGKRSRSWAYENAPSIAMQKAISRADAIESDWISDCNLRRRFHNDVKAYLAING